MRKGCGGQEDRPRMENASVVVTIFATVSKFAWSHFGGYPESSLAFILSRYFQLRLFPVGGGGVVDVMLVAVVADHVRVEVFQKPLR